MAQIPRVLMYHSISSTHPDPFDISVEPEAFETQMGLLGRLGYCGVPMRTFCEAQARGKASKLVGLTFDDAYEDFLHTAVPILKNHGFGATVFAVAEMVGHDNRWDHSSDSDPRLSLLDSDGLREVVSEGMEVGSHTLTHPRLDELEPADSLREISDSRLLLENIVGDYVDGFCYPYGNLNREVASVVEKSGYSYACGIELGRIGGCFDVPRIPIRRKDGSPRFLAKLLAYWQFRTLKNKYVGGSPTLGVAGAS